MTLRSLDRSRFRSLICFAPEGGTGGGNDASGGTTVPTSPTPSSPAPSSPAAPAPSGAPSTPSTPASAKPAAGGLQDAPPDTTGLGSPSDPFDYDQFFAGDESLSEVGGEAPVVPPPAQPGTTPATPPPPAGVEPAAQQAEGAAVVAPAPTEPAAPPSPQTTEARAEGPSLDASEPGSILRSMVANEAAFLGELTKSFVLSKEDVEGLESDLIGTVPKLLAKVYYQANVSALQHIQRIVPATIQRMTAAVERNGAAESEFYGQFPDLKPDASINFAGKPTTVRDLTRQYAALYRRMHPQASKAELFAHIGPMVMMAAQVRPSAAAAGQPPTPLAPLARPPGFVPAPSGGASQPSQVELNVVEAMFSHPDT